LGIGNLTEPFFWVAVLLIGVPFVFCCFVFVRFVAPLTFKDVLHLSLYPIGAGVFTGAAFTLVASAVVALLVAAGLIPEIKFDFGQWGGEAQLVAVKQQVLNECLKQESFVFTVLAAALQEPYTKLRPPIDALSYLRPAITVLYFVIAALMFKAAVDRRKGVIFGLVLLAAFVATAATALSLGVYLTRKIENSSCQENLTDRTLNRVGESMLKRFASDMEVAPGIKDNAVFAISISAQGRTVNWIYRFKAPVNLSEFYRANSQQQKGLYEARCSKSLLSVLKAQETHTFYSSSGERLTSFSIDSADCGQQW
jgi:hypothetical protein